MIELGHYGEPVDDVILRIYRESFRNDDKREKKIKKEGSVKRDKEREGYYYSKRINLGDDCDEVFNIFFFFFFCFFNY